MPVVNNVVFNDCIFRPLSELNFDLAQIGCARMMAQLATPKAAEDVGLIMQLGEVKRADNALVVNKGCKTFQPSSMDTTPSGCPLRPMWSRPWRTRTQGWLCALVWARLNVSKPDVLHTTMSQLL